MKLAVRWKNASVLTPSGRSDAENPRQQLETRLHRALGPAVLLRLEGVHLHRHFGRGDEVGQEDELPALQLRAVAQVEIFGQRVVLPAAGIVDGRAAARCRPCR